jgi:hypothetical protein
MERPSAIETELSGIAPVLGKQRTTALPYRVPEGYFGEFPENLLRMIREIEDPEEEIRAISPLLAGLDRKDPYKVPDGYFHELKPRKDALSGAKIIPLHPIRLVLRYAAAAFITGLIATTVFFSLRQNSSDPLNGLAGISDQEMANYLENHDIHWVPGTSVSASPTASVDFDDNDISALLSNVSDAELEQYFPDLPGGQRTTN